MGLPIKSTWRHWSLGAAIVLSAQALEGEDAGMTKSQLIAALTAGVQARLNVTVPRRVMEYTISRLQTSLVLPGPPLRRVTPAPSDGPAVLGARILLAIQLDGVQWPNQAPTFYGLDLAQIQARVNRDQSGVWRACTALHRDRILIRRTHGSADTHSPKSIFGLHRSPP